MVKINEEKFLSFLKEKANMSEEMGLIALKVFKEHHLIGKNNKDKIVKDLENYLNISEVEADKIYNIWAEFNISSIINRNDK